MKTAPQLNPTICLVPLSKQDIERVMNQKSALSEELAQLGQIHQSSDDIAARIQACQATVAKAARSTSADAITESQRAKAEIQALENAAAELGEKEDLVLHHLEVSAKFGWNLINEVITPSAAAHRSTAVKSVRPYFQSDSMAFGAASQMHSVTAFTNWLMMGSPRGGKPGAKVDAERVLSELESILAGRCPYQFDAGMDESTEE